MTELPEDHMKAVQHGLTLFQKAQHEITELKEKLLEANLQVTELKTQLDHTTEHVNLLESRMRGYQAERDQAVGERAVYEALFISIAGQLKAFKIPTEPVVKLPPASSLEKLAVIADKANSQNGDKS